MKKFIIKHKVELSYLLVSFLFLMLLYFLSPISGDDYGCYNSTNGSLVEAFDSAVGMYFSWEGRFVGRIFIMLFAHHKIIFNIVTPLLFCIMIFGVVKLMGVIKNKGTYFLLLISLMLLNCDMFAQVYTWVAGSVTYLYPSIIAFVYFVYIYFKRNSKFKIYDYVIFFIVNIVGTMFVENIGCSLVVGNFLLMIYFYRKDRAKFYTFLGCCIVSMVSLGAMLLSPGSAARSATNLEFNSLSLLGKIHINLKNFVKFLFARNIVMIILMLIIINYVFKKKKINFWLVILFNIIPIISIIENVRFYAPVYVDFLYFDIHPLLDFSRGLYIWYWILFLGTFLYSLYIIFKNQSEKLMFMYFLIVVSLVSTVVMIILSTWGDRVTFFSVMTLVIVSIIAINEIIENKFSKIISLFGMLVIIYYVFFFSLIYVIDEKRVNDIYAQVNEGKKEVQLLDNPVRYLWNNNIPGDYFVRTYRQYLGLNDDITLIKYKLTYKEYVLLLFE